MLNLLSNAIKFTQQGAIQLSIHHEQQAQQEWLIFEVSDTGIGISAESQQSIFKTFTQADNSTTRQYGGTGLGLSIVKQFTDLLESIRRANHIGTLNTCFFSIQLNKASIGWRTLETTVDNH